MNGIPMPSTPNNLWFSVPAGLQPKCSVHFRLFHTGYISPSLRFFYIKNTYGAKTEIAANIINETTKLWCIKFTLTYHCTVE
jgi:hypothetical protein